MPSRHAHATHYDVLEVSPQASTSTIRAAYKSLMQRYHPDRLKTPSAQDQARRINTAYAVLSDPEQRRRYDESLASSATAQAPSQTNPRLSPTATSAGGSRVIAALVVVLSILGIVSSVGLWWWTVPPDEVNVGTVQYDPTSPVVEVIAQLGSLRDAQGIAQATLLFRTADGRPFRINAQEVARGSSVVRYDCETRRYITTQNQMQLPDGSVVKLVDSSGMVTPKSASERTLELACAPWWRRWRLL